MTVDGSVRALRHTAKNALLGRQGLSKEEQLANLDTAIEALTQARAIVEGREVVNGPAASAPLYAEDADDEADDDYDDEDEDFDPDAHA